MNAENEGNPTGMDESGLQKCENHSRVSITYGRPIGRAV
jgi:hypothetical protein